MMRSIQKKPCPVCASDDISRILGIPDVPVHCNLLWENREDAVNAPKGDIHLEFCETCGHMYNSMFDPDRMDYSDNYENALHFSPSFQSYANNLAEQLIKEHNLRGKSIIDIGCGDGEFLKLLCELGDNRGVGFDPGFSSKLIGGNENNNLVFIKDIYSEKYASHQADFICCRQVLEHLADPGNFLEMLHRTLADNPHIPLFFEVPNSRFIIKDRSIWDIIYEHYSYFSTRSLTRLFSRNGFAVPRIEEAFGKQYLWTTVFPVKSGSHPSMEIIDEPSDIKKHVEKFAGSYQKKINASKEKLRQIKEAYKKAVLWGAGSKGVTFLNMLNINDEISYVVDINPRKQDMFIAGTGQKIVHPDFLNTYSPDIIFISNPIYEQEIRQMIRSHKLSVDYTIL